MVLIMVKKCHNESVTYILKVKVIVKVWNKKKYLLQILNLIIAINYNTT
jgi:hypothetical protein